MKLEYLGIVNSEGDEMIRLWNFNQSQAIKFRDAVHDNIIKKNKSFNLTELDFIETINCSLIFRINSIDEGITTVDNSIFYCDLTIQGYEKMIYMMEPFCEKECTGYQWLYEIDTPIEFLFSQGGTW